MGCTEPDADDAGGWATRGARGHGEQIQTVKPVWRVRKASWRRGRPREIYGPDEN